MRMNTALPDSLKTDANAAVLTWLSDKSARDEVASALLNATRALGDVVTYCPDPKQFRYVLTATRGTVFGVATGMSTVSFRLDREMCRRALQSGRRLLPRSDLIGFRSRSFAVTGRRRISRSGR